MLGRLTEREPKPLTFLCTIADMPGSGVSFELPPRIVCSVLVNIDNYTLSSTTICGDALAHRTPTGWPSEPKPIMTDILAANNPIVQLLSETAWRT